MSTAVWTNRLEVSSSAADWALNAAAKFWFVVALVGQFVFAFSIASFYGLNALRGDFGAWNRVLYRGLVPGATMSNTALAGHILFGALISFAGALQLIPRIRQRFPGFHRWNGRVYLLAAFTQGITGLYLTIFRGAVPGTLVEHFAIWISGVLLIVCAAMALRYALARDFKTHRRWALRLFLVASGSWFFRVGFSMTVLLFGPIGFDSTTFSGPLPTFWTFAEYLLPLAALEIYFYAQDRPGAVRRMATAGLLTVLTLGMGAGIAVASASQWIPRVKEAYDSRRSIAGALSATISSSGIDAAVKQYHDLKATASTTYNFDEVELNRLGYQLLKAKKFKEAIRIFQLNVEAYPKSSNVFDSLGEAYMDNGDNEEAIGNYRRSLKLNPKNGNGARMLEKLKAAQGEGI